MKNNISFNSSLSKFGIGLFETIKIENVPIDFELHINRLYSSVKDLNIKTIVDKNTLIELNKILYSDSESFVVRDSISNDNEDIQIKDIVSVCPSISVENAYVEDGRSIVQGIIKVDVLYVPAEGLRLVYKISEEIPFEHDVEIDDLTDSASVFNTVSIEKIEVDLNRDKIELSAKVKRFVEAIDKKSESFIIKGEDHGDYDLSKAPSITVYISKEGDSLWNIAKKYNTTEEEIATLNEIKIDEPLKAGKCLILEKKVALFD